MSGSNTSNKPPQVGLVDMGNISFYNNQSDPIPPFTISDLAGTNGIALYGNSFSEIVLNVTWAQLQPTSPNKIDTSVIDSAIAQVQQYNITNNTNLGIKLRVWGGFVAPAWTQAIDGTPLTVTGPGTVDPDIQIAQPIGRFWTADYLDAWTNLQQQLAQIYDSNPLIRGISNTTGAAATDEPFVPLNPSQMAQLVARGYTDAAEQLVLRTAIADYSSWSTTPLDYTMNVFHLVDSGKDTADPNFTLAVLQAAVTSSRVVQAGNHALNNPLLSTDAFVYAQMAAYAAMIPGAPPGSYQTASPVNLGSTANWSAVVAQGVTADAGDIELWDFPDNHGFTGQSASFVANLGSTLAAGIPPTTTAPDNGSALAFIAPALVSDAVGTIALTGVDAALLASTGVASSYDVTIISSSGHTLEVANFATLVGDVMQGSTLSFRGSLDQINTTLASLTDTLVQPGIDIVLLTASDNLGDTATQSIGVVASPSNSPLAASAIPAGSFTSDAATTYTWTGVGGNTAFSDAANWQPAGGPPGSSDTAIFSAGTNEVTVSGTGAAGALVVDTIVVPGGGSTLAVGQNGTGDVTIAGQADTAGVLIFGGVHTSLTIAGNLEIGGAASGSGGIGVLLAALAPSAYSTATLTVGGTLQVWPGGTAQFSGALAANTVTVLGKISGDGTLTTAGGAIANNGVIEAVADQTLGLQQLTLADDVTGIGTLVVDPAATLILAGSVAASQTIAFLPNSIVQFADDPYSPSTLVLEQPLVTSGSVINQTFAGSITGFTFADSLVLDGVDAIALTPTAYQNGTLTIVDQITGGTLDFALSGTLDHLTPVAIDSGTTDAPTTTVMFVAAGLGQLPSVSAPAAIQAETGQTITVPDIVLQTPQPATPSNNTTVLVTVDATNGALDTGSNDFNTTIGTLNGGHTLLLSGSLGSVERSLQTLTYASSVAGSDTITLAVSDYFGMSADTTIAVNTGTGAASFLWAHPVNGDFATAGNWATTGTAASTPPGGANFALFNNGTAANNNPYTVSGNGAVGRIVVADTVTFTGQVLAQGLGTEAVVVDGSLGTGGVLMLSGGAVLTSAQTAIIGNSASGMLTVMGGALDLTTADTTAAALIIGNNSASAGTVLDFEQITAQESIVVGAAGSGTLRLLGIAATVSDGGADIGSSVGGRGVAVVDGGSWANAGQIIIGDAGAGSLLISGAANGLTGQVTATSADFGEQAGSSGTVTLVDGDLLVANATTPTTSTFTIGDAGSGALTINGGNVTVGAPLVDNGSTLFNGTLTVGATFGGTGVIDIANSGSLLVEGNAVVGAGGTGTVRGDAAGSALFALTGSLGIGASGQVALGNASDTIRAADISIAPGGRLSGAGTVSGDGGGNNTVLLTSIDNAGTIAASGGDLLLYGQVTGNGAITLETNAALTLQAGIGAGQTLTFASGAEAVLNDPLAFAGTITAFTAGDILDLASTSVSSASWATGTLTLVTQTDSIALNVGGSYAPNAFVIQSDSLGGTLVELACFAAGTRIMTPDGLVPIDILTEGDLVVTHQGTAQPIRWIGWRRVDCRRHPRPDAVWPVRIAAGAFGPDAPERNLYLSPDHAVYADGVLIPIKYLLNGRTLRQMRVSFVTYYHLELHRHSVLIAEGLPMESYLDTGRRSAFANAPGVVDLHPSFGRSDTALHWDALGYAPLCVTGPIVEAVRARLATVHQRKPRCSTQVRNSRSPRPCLL